MIEIRLSLIGIFLLYNIQMVNSIICYQCTDCPEPFTDNYPYVTLINNTNFLAQCTKTIMDMGDGRRVITKGSVFFCPTQSTATDVQILCCAGDYCNSSGHQRLSMLLFYLSFSISSGIYFFFN